jgi:hypothetical protein
MCGRCETRVGLSVSQGWGATHITQMVTLPARLWLTQCQAKAGHQGEAGQGGAALEGESSP